MTGGAPSCSGLPGKFTENPHGTDAGDLSDLANPYGSDAISLGWNNFGTFIHFQLTWRRDRAKNRAFPHVIARLDLNPEFTVFSIPLEFKYIIQ
jgi:hypothetical protein